jgi:hypothetical protein
MAKIDFPSLMDGVRRAHRGFGVPEETSCHRTGRGTASV